MIEVSIAIWISRIISYAAYCRRRLPPTLAGTVALDGWRTFRGTAGGEGLAAWAVGAAKRVGDLGCLA